MTTYSIQINNGRRWGDIVRKLQSREDAERILEQTRHLFVPSLQFRIIEVETA